MTTTVTIRTIEGAEKTEWSLTVGDLAQKHVLRSFNVTNDPGVDATKVLCAALIQQMLDVRNREQAMQGTLLRGTPELDRCFARQRAADRSIEMLEQVQMQCVKTNFVQA